MLRKKTNEKDPADWFAFAEDRLTAADVLWKHEGLTATGIETLRQQSGELVALIRESLPQYFTS